MLIKYNAFSLLFLYFIIKLKQVSAACSEEEWDCDNGQCIHIYDTCDGVVHCADGTDEVAENCIHMQCPKFAFHCTYGACITGSLKCDGRKNCVDGSDELPLLCNENKFEIRQQYKGNCSDDSLVQCLSGECITYESTCDGRFDCEDGSDETLELCSTTFCPNYAFKCGYGGCIRGNAKCDGIEDCRDGSDEAAQLCGTVRKRFYYNNMTTTSTTMTTTKAPHIIPSIPTSYCRIPYDRTNLIATIFDSVALYPGAHVDTNTFVTFICNPGYTLEGDMSSYCLPGGRWNTDVPTCTRFCSVDDITKDISISVICKNGRQQISCKNNIQPGMTAIINCAESFNQPKSNVDRFVDELKCRDDGTWNDKAGTCKMECGLVEKPYTTFVVGTDTKPSEVPWHVAIYHLHDTERYTYSCGGTIISPFYVLSAAHCFWDKTTEDTYDAFFYTVVAGKFNKDYYNRDDHTFQAHNVSTITIPTKYKDASNTYYQDAALLKLKTVLKFSYSVRPVCLKWRNEDAQSVDSELVATVAGWGSTDNKAQTLQSLKLETLSYSKCKSELAEMSYNLKTDKFCVHDQLKICKGDSGGGVVVAERDNGVLKYYLIGIVSHGPNQQSQCAKNYTVVTNIQYINEFRDFKFLV